MIDVHELLRKKENDINRVRKEIHALQLVAPLLSDSEETRTAPDHAQPKLTSQPVEETAPVEDVHASLASGEFEGVFEGELEAVEGSSEPIPPKRGMLREWFSRAAGE